MRGARGGFDQNRTLDESPRPTASRTQRKPRKKNTPCFLDLAGVKFLLKKERVFFFRGSFLQKLSTHWVFCFALLTKVLNESCGSSKYSLLHPPSIRAVWRGEMRCSDGAGGGLGGGIPRHPHSFFSCDGYKNYSCGYSLVSTRI